MSATGFKLRKVQACVCKTTGDKLNTTSLVHFRRKNPITKIKILSCQLVALILQRQPATFFLSVSSSLFLSSSCECVVFVLFLHRVWHANKFPHLGWHTG